MIIQEFVKTFAEKKIINTKINEHAVSDYLKKELDIKTYIPFKEKRQIAEMIVVKNIEIIDGIKKYDSINAYIGFIMASVVAHTNLECGDDPIADYDLLAESGLLTQIVMEFQESHNEIDILLKMALAAELEDNNINILIGKFMNEILQKVDVIGDALRNKIGNINITDILGGNFKQEDLAKLKGFLDRYNK